MDRVHTSVFRPAVAGMIVLLASPVLAQAPTEPSSTHASILDAARAARTSESVPPERSNIDKALSWYDNQYVLAKIFSGWKGIRIGGGDFPAGAGMKFGAAYDKALTSRDSDPTLPNRLDLMLRGAYSTRGYARVNGSINARNLGGKPIEINAFGQYYEFPQEDYFGQGMDSLESDRTNYLLDAIESGASVHWKPYKLDFGAGASYLSPRVGQGTDSRFASTEEVFGPATTPGLGTSTDFIKVHGSVAFDWRDNQSYPHAGGRYEVTGTKFDDHDLGQFDFYRVDVHLQHYIPLASRYQTLAFRAIGAFTDADSGQLVPFYLQPTLGGHRDLRGFRESRFRDENTLLLGAEYRWEAWWALDGALFVDAGTVSHSRQDLSIGNMDVSYGVGFRFHSNRALVGRLDLAFSREGFIPLLRFEHVF